MLSFDEQIELIKHWIDEQEEGEGVTKFIISDYGNDGYEVVAQLTTDYFINRCCIFVDTMFRPKSNTPFLDQFKLKVRVTLDTYIEGMRELIKTL